MRLQSQPTASHRVEIFCGRRSNMAADVYVQVPDLPGGERWSLKGRLRGPFTPVARTLPATAELIDAGSGPTLLGRIAVVDPCYWSPDMPARYELHLELYEGGSQLNSAEQSIGLRWMGVAGSSLRFQQERWVLRGAVVAEPIAHLASWQDARMTVVTRNPTAEFCETASRDGVMVIAWMDSPKGNLGDELHRLSQTPAVAGAVIAVHQGSAGDLRRAAGDLLLAEYISQLPGRHESWADMVFARVDQPNQFGEFLSACRTPVIAMRRVGSQLSPSDARRECDRLQRDLAPLGQCAGYVVNLPPNL